MRDGDGTRRWNGLTKLAARQHGVVSLQQLGDLGYSRSDVSRHTRAGRLQRLLPLIYRVAGTPSSLEQRAIAAALWAGPDAVVSHQTAAALWQMCGPGNSIDVSSSRRITSPPAGVQAHLGDVPNRDRGRLRGVPVTSPARTLLDLAAQRTEGRLLPVVERAILGDLVAPAQVLDVLRRNPGRRGCRRLAGCLDLAGSSALERRVQELLAGAGLPPHVREHPVGDFRLDFAWPDVRVAIEADGRRWHSSAPAFERDRAKHNLLTRSGWRVLRLTWRDLADPAPLLAQVGRLLEAA